MKMTMNGIIYLGVNNVTQKRYIGATTHDLTKRIREHYDAALTSKGSLFTNELFLYGVDKFNFEIIDTASTTDELAQKEIYYIQAYNTFENGYNSDRGGGFRKTIYQFEFSNPEPIATYQTLEEAGNSVNASRKTISSACLGSLKSAKGFLWSYIPEYPKIEDKRSKTVYQYSLDGLLLATFSSAREASRQLGIGLSSITRCCRGERKQTSGFKFSY